MLHLRAPVVFVVFKLHYEKEQEDEFASRANA